MTLKVIDGQACRRLTGVMILHGFTANLDSVRTLFEPLGGMGLELVTPLLRGHGQHSPDALRGVTWQDWLADAELAMISSAGRDGKLVVLGHSMGALLALQLAALHPDLVDSVILATPAIRLASVFAPGRPFHFLAPMVSMLFDRWSVDPRFADPSSAIKPKNYEWVPTATILSLFDLVDATVLCLSRVSAPTCIIHGRNESIVLPESADFIMQSISTPTEDKSVVWFEKTEHQIFCDCERSAAVSAVRKFIAARIEKSLKSLSE